MLHNNMAATKNPLQELWHRKGQDDLTPKPQASGGPAISTRSRAAEERTAVEKEATSRMAPGHKGDPDDAACAQVDVSSHQAMHCGRGIPLLLKTLRHDRSQRQLTKTSL